MEEDYVKMSGAELVSAYNKMAGSAEGVALQTRTVTRFADQATAVKRCLALASSIKARKEGLKGTSEKDVPAAKPVSTAAPAKKPATVKKEGAKPVQTGIAAEFEARAGTIREKLLLALHANFKKQVPLNTLLKATYGNLNTENKGALMMSMKGALLTIKNKKLPYEIKKEKVPETKELTFGLYPVK